MNKSPDPTGGIRAVLVTGFVAGNVSALFYMATRGVLIEAIQLNPIAVLGGFLAVGLVGMITGTMCGLSLRLILERIAGASKSWWPPVLFAAVVSGAIGLLIVRLILGVLSTP
jgi:hypothetical protein